MSGACNPDKKCSAASNAAGNFKIEICYNKENKTAQEQTQKYMEFLKEKGIDGPFSIKNEEGDSIKIIYNNSKGEKEVIHDSNTLEEDKFEALYERIKR